MPELPEVEVICRTLRNKVIKQKITKVKVRSPKLRWPIPSNLAQNLEGSEFTGLERRSKYMLFANQKGHLLVHLGMSGTLTLATPDTPPDKHDHVDLIFGGTTLLRYRDPRRFGAILWTSEDPELHPRLCNLGVEPLSPEFDHKYLYDISRKSKKAIKLFLMDSHKVVGIGNIYANESLFYAGVHPEAHTSDLNPEKCKTLVKVIRQVLQKAIKAGGTTLQDHRQADGKMGYFQQQLAVYGRGGQACLKCTAELKTIDLGGRQTTFCPKCQRYGAP